MTAARTGATYTKLSLDDLDLFLKRTFRALQPVRKEGSSDYFYDLYLSHSVKIQVWSSIYKGDTEVKSTENHPMKIIFMGRRGRISPKEPEIIVKRVEGWKGNLRSRIEELVELYHVDPEGWDAGTKMWDPSEYKDVVRLTP